ncbi:MAG TPA: NAD(P)H-binding protein [Anaerolineales bacterium]|nr:NAD(P)H-binding protein [Anaerolineales bacterium]
MKKTILVIGGTGLLGEPVSRWLSDAGFQVRVMTRDQQKARKLFNDSFEVFVGDPTDVNCLEEALHGSYGVHISIPGKAEQQVAETVAKLASKHAVERISYISGATVAEENRWFPMVNGKFLAEKAIRASGIPYAIFCPTWVMDTLPMFVNQGRAAVFGKQPCPYHWVAAEDIARAVATAYELKEAPNKRFIIHGPEAIRMQEALKRYCAVFHPEIKAVTSMPFWLVKLLAAFTHNQGLKDVGEMMSYFEKVGEGSQLPEVDGILGAPVTTLDMWLRKRKETKAI